MPVNVYHALVLDGSGSFFFCAGDNTNGQLGTGDKNPREIFTQVNLPVKFISLSAGHKDHSLGIAEQDGSLWSWGSNEYGQLGHGKNVPFLNQPTQIPNTQNFIQISAGHQFSLALDSNGKVWSFGDGSFGRLGLRNSEHQFIPCQIEGLPPIKSISAGFGFGIVLDENGNAWSFGENFQGQLGLGLDYDQSLSTPCKIERVRNIIQISCGYYHCLILDSQSCVWSFGCNLYGQLGDPETTQETINMPIIIPNMKDSIQIFAAGSSSIVKNALQQVFVFGDNHFNQIVTENKSSVTVPVEQEMWRNKTIIPGDFTISLWMKRVACIFLDTLPLEFLQENMESLWDVDAQPS